MRQISCLKTIHGVITIDHIDPLEYGPYMLSNLEYLRFMAHCRQWSKNTRISKTYLNQIGIEGLTIQMADYFVRDFERRPPYLSMKEERLTDITPVGSYHVFWLNCPFCREVISFRVDREDEAELTQVEFPGCVRCPHSNTDIFNLVGSIV